MTAQSQSPVPVLRVRTPDGRTFRFSHDFHVGRADECAVRIQDPMVSGKHLAISFSDGRWIFRDLHSTNGVFLDAQLVETGSIEGSTTLYLGGTDGTALTLDVETPAPAPRPTASAVEPQKSPRDATLLDSYADRYFGSTAESPDAGDRTIMIRKAFQKIQKQQKRRHRYIVATLALVGLVAASYAYYGYRQMRQQEAVAQDLFYAMKSLDVDIASVERLVATPDNTQGQEQARRYREKRREMEANYERFLGGLNLYNRKLSDRDQLILRVTRRFGECELAAPPEYLAEVNRYIERWRSTGRFVRGVKLAQDLGYTNRIAQEFLKQNLARQFFYLALQESDFQSYTSGTPTSWGIAKGMWQFIPDTARRYGLTVGPLAAVPKPDPADDRQKWEKATVAAARYIKDIYSTDAQASGLLVMASYKWGERRVIDLIKTLPPNPRERNFWKLLARYRERIPKETYDYVFSIVSAAVIGENPRLFGYSFDSPLASVVTQ